MQKFYSSSRSFSVLSLLALALAFFNTDALARHPVTLKVDMKTKIAAKGKNNIEQEQTRWLEIEASTLRLDQDGPVKIEWSILTRDLDSGGIAIEGRGEDIIPDLNDVKRGNITGSEVTFGHTRSHTEVDRGQRRPGQRSQPRVNLKNNKASGSRYYGWAVRAYQGSEIVGEIYSTAAVESFMKK